MQNKTEIRWRNDLKMDVVRQNSQHIYISLK